MSVSDRRVAAAALVLLFGSAAAAPRPDDPHYTDAAGDANGLWGYDGVFTDTNNGKDLRPVSVDSADVVAAWFSTTYDTVSQRDDQGRIVAIEYVPTGLSLTVETVAPASPTFGPTLAFDFYGMLGDDCSLGISIDVHGPATGADDPAEGARIYRTGSGCAGGFRHLDVDGVAFDGHTMTVTFPFALTLVDGVQIVPLGGTIADAFDDEFGGEVYPIRRDSDGTSGYPPIIDTFDPPIAYTIGEDVPENVDCMEAPTDACG